MRDAPVGDAPVGDARGLEPLLVTAVLDTTSQDHFDALRRAHFPPERNHLSAHVTLFHHLPGVSREAVDEALRRAAQRPPFQARVSGVASLGRGVAFTLDAPELMQLHAELADAWAGMLTRQDSRAFWPHLTVQNKVPPAKAQALLAELTASFIPRPILVESLGLWRYLGGPWQPVRTFPLGPPSTCQTHGCL